jgi:ADP-ribosyl-[dinitrogen reductase] hydrolase
LAAGGRPSPEKVEHLGRGAVAEEALAIAVYAALVADDFRAGVLLAINHSGDSDSTGCIAGHTLGTIHGVEGIPPEWLDGLESGDVVERIANDFVDAFYTERVFPNVLYPAW